jgi:signal transduction histidine kinase
MTMIVLLTVGLAGVVVALARFTNGSGVEEHVPHGQRTAVLAVFVPMILGLVVLQAWQNHAGLLRQGAALQASRRRLVTATDDVRRQIERDLHDSTQQRLVAAAIQLRVAERLVAEQPERATDLLDRLVGEVQDTAVELRELSHGVYPPELTHHGLRHALDTLAQRSSRPVTVKTVEVGRYRADVEATVYFCCVEAVQNITKYAGDDACVVISVDGRGPLTYAITDNGAGFAAGPTDGRGLLNMLDRVGAVGGTLRVRSTPGRGTRITGIIPNPPPADRDGEDTGAIGAQLSVSPLVINA